MPAGGRFALVERPAPSRLSRALAAHSGVYVAAPVIDGGRWRSSACAEALDASTSERDGRGKPRDGCSSTVVDAVIRHRDGHARLAHARPRRMVACPRRRVRIRASTRVIGTPLKGEGSPLGSYGLLPRPL